MNRSFLNATPESSKSCLNNSRSLFHDFVRPRGQIAAKCGSSPFMASPRSDDFIPLSYSTPVTNMNGGVSGGNWKGDNPKNFSPTNLRNSSFTPYSVKKNHFGKRSPSSYSNSSFARYNHMDRSRNYSTDRRDNNFLANMQNSDDISQYYHPSMLEDPWAELEQELRNRTPDQNCSLGGQLAREKSISYSSTVDSRAFVSDSDEGADSQGTDSSVVASDGSS